MEEILSVISSCKAGRKESSIPIQKMTPDDVMFLLHEYQSYLQEFQQFDFDDLMQCCLTLLREDACCLAAWQAQFRYILVDVLYMNISS